MVTLPVKLSFSEELSVLDLYADANVPPPDFESLFGGDSIPLFDYDIESRTTTVVTPEYLISLASRFNLSYDIEADEIKTALELDVDNPTFGDITIFYPVSTTLELPSFVDTPGANFEISTGNNFSSTLPFLIGEAVDFGVFGLDFTFGIDSYQISNLSFNPSLFNVPLPSITLLRDGIDLISDPIDETYRLFTVPGELNLENIGLFDIEFGFPEGDRGFDLGQFSPSGVLEPLSVEVDSTAFSFSGDIVDLILTVATLGSSRLLRPVVDIVDAFRVEIPIPENIPGIGGENIELSLNPLALNLDIDVTTTQSFNFNPNDITATVSFLTDGVEGDLESKPLGESFSFTAPDNLEGPIVGEVVYTLSSEITLEYVLEIDASGSIELSGLAVALPEPFEIPVLDGIDGGSFSLDRKFELPLEETFDVPLQFTQPFQISTDRDEESSIIDVPPITPPPIDIPNIIAGTPDNDLLIGTNEDDIITGGQGQDTLTGGGGSDQFVYTSIVDAGDTITDFEVGVDQIVLTEVLDSFGYQGSDPIADEYVRASAAFSGSFVQIDPDGMGSGSSRFFILVENLTVTGLDNTDNFVF